MTIVSFAYRFIFCKTMKTAGTALEVSIASRLPATDVVTPLVPPEPGHRPRNFRHQGVRLRNHVPVARIRDVFGSDVEGFSAFCIERHPVEKCLSHYAMVRHSPKHLKRGEFQGMTWSDYVQHGVFPIDLARYASPDQSGGWVPAVDVIIDYTEMENGVAKFLLERGLRDFKMISKAKSGFRKRAGVPQSQDVSGAQVEAIMRKFQASNDFLAKHFGIVYGAYPG